MRGLRSRRVHATEKSLVFQSTITSRPGKTTSPATRRQSEG
jgi:hypothetical protein